MARRDGIALLLIAVSCYIHPTSGFIAFGLLSLIIIWRANYTWNMRLSSIWVLCALVGVLPAILKFLVYDVPPELTGQMSYSDWYSQLIKDEADDFSVIFQLLYRTQSVVLIFGTIGVICALYARLFKDYRVRLSFWAALAIPILYLHAALFEYVFGVLYPTVAIYPLITLTIGYRFLSFAFFPIVVLSSRITAHIWHLHSAWLNKSGSQILRRTGPIFALDPWVIIILVWTSFLWLGLKEGRLVASSEYAKWAVTVGRAQGADSYLRGAANTGRVLYSQPNAYQNPEDFITYPGERNLIEIRRLDKAQPKGKSVDGFRKTQTLEAFLDLIRQIRQKIPVGSGFYVPPYLRGFRDSLPEYEIFFQEHFDGNYMMGAPSFMRFWNVRMVDLMGFTYEGMPSKETGLSNSVMRKAYLNINERKATGLYEKYPAYRYLISESQHQLRFEAVVQSEVFVVYDLAKPIEPPN